MATTTNYSWTTPDDTALVKDGAAAIRSLGTAIDTTVFNNAGAAIAKSLIDAEGDLIVGDADNAVQRLAIGSNGDVLTVDTTVDGKIKWAAVPASTPTFAGCSASNTSTNISIANNTITKIALNTEEFDTDGYHDNSTNNTRFTIPAGKAGYYLVTGSTVFYADPDGERIIYIYKNNSDVKWAWSVPNAAADCGMRITAVLNLAVSDYVEIAVKHTAGSATNSSWANGQYGWFEISYLGA